MQHKVREAYQKVGKAVLVEDVSLEFIALGRLPGPFIKWFIDELSCKDIWALLDGKKRDAVARCIFGYFDGEVERYFEGSLSGSIAELPRGHNGFGWNKIFILEGYQITRAEMEKEDDEKTYQCIKPFAEVSSFFQQ